MNDKAFSKRTMKTAESVSITEYDRKRLTELIRDIREIETTGGLRKLEARLERAITMKPREIAENVVTMNCLVRLRDAATGEQREYWLRFSRESETFSRVVPILSELGIALLGSREGDTIEWSGPEGRRRSTIVEIIYQPERLGNYEL